MCNSKVIRSLSLLLLFSLFLTGFGSVDVSAAENLINPDLTQWQNVNLGNLSDSDVSEVTITRYNNFYRLNADYLGVLGDSPATHYWLGHMFDDSSLKAGRSYTFSIHLPSISELKSNSSLANLSDSFFTDAYSGNGQLLITFGTIKSDGSVNPIVELLKINNSNYQDLMGTDYIYNFECPDFSGGNPGIIIYVFHDSASLKSNPSFFLGKNMSLVDENAAEQDNIFNRLFEWFEKKFNAIGESFSNLGNKVSTGFSNLGDRIKTFFTDLGDSISSGLTAVKEGIQNKLEELKASVVQLCVDLLNGIKGLFVPSEDYILTWKSDLQQLLQEHLGIIYTSGDLITTLLEKTSDIVFNAPDTYGLTIPDVTFELPDGTLVQLFQETDISFDFMENNVFKTMYGLYGIALYILFGSLEVKYALRVYRKVMAN